MRVDEMIVINPPPPEFRVVDRTLPGEGPVEKLAREMYEYMMACKPIVVKNIGGAPFVEEKVLHEALANPKQPNTGEEP